MNWDWLYLMFGPDRAVLDKLEKNEVNRIN